MNVPYDTASGYRDAEAYREELEAHRREYQERLYELSKELTDIADHAYFCELDKSAEDLVDLIDEIKYIADQLQNLERDYESA